MNEEPKKDQQSKGVKKHAGLYDNAVTADERDAAQRNPEAHKTSVSEDTGIGERISDGRRETYTGNTAAELAKPTPK